MLKEQKLNFECWPLISINGSPQPSHADDKFYPDTAFLIYEDRSIMSDWAVLKLKRNINSHDFPGESYGFYKVSFQDPLLNDSIQIAGYGSNLELEIINV